MGKQDRFTDEFKRDPVAQVVDRGYRVREVAERLGISTKSIYTWQNLFSRPEKMLLPRNAQAVKIRRTMRDLVRLRDARDVLQKGLEMDACRSKFLAGAYCAGVPLSRSAGKPLPQCG